MSDATPLPFDLPAVARKKLTAAFDGGNQSSDAGLLLLRAAEDKVGVIEALASALVDWRDPARIRHTLTEIMTARVFAICCGHEDAIDHDHLRGPGLDPGSAAEDRRRALSGERCGARLSIDHHTLRERAIEDGRPALLTCTDRLARQACEPVIPRYLRHRRQFRCGPTWRSRALHGRGQQGTFWNGHHDERGYAPMHIFHAGSGLPVATILRPAKTPDGEEVRAVIKHVTQRLRETWDRDLRSDAERRSGSPRKRANIVRRGDSHYGRAEAMDWCDDNSVGYIVGLPGNSVLAAATKDAAEHLRFWHALSDAPKSRCYKCSNTRPAVGRRHAASCRRHASRMTRASKRRCRTIRRRRNLRASVSRSTLATS